MPLRVGPLHPAKLSISYNSREKDLTVFSIAYHRSTSVIIGVIWAAVVSRYWWPFTARRELRMGLSE
jgi:hypothetical protein